MHRAYGYIGQRLGVGQVPAPPHGVRSLVVVPVHSVSTLTREALSAALSLGGNVRVGLEDNFYLDSAGKEMARSNGELVAKAVRMARDMGTP